MMPTGNRWHADAWKKSQRCNTYTYIFIQAHFGFMWTDRHTQVQKETTSTSVEEVIHTAAHIQTLNGLTWHSVDGFQGPKDPHCSNGRQVDVLQVQWVLHHPGMKKRQKQRTLLYILFIRTLYYFFFFCEIKLTINLSPVTIIQLVDPDQQRVIWIIFSVQGLINSEQAPEVDHGSTSAAFLWSRFACWF